MAIEIQTDSIKGTGTGKGRMKIRLNDDETMKGVKESLQKAGVRTALHQDAASKKTNMTSTEF